MDTRVYSTQLLLKVHPNDRFELVDFSVPLFSCVYTWSWMLHVDITPGQAVCAVQQTPALLYCYIFRVEFPMLQCGCPLQDLVDVLVFTAFPSELPFSATETDCSFRSSWEDSEYWFHSKPNSETSLVISFARPEVISLE